MSKITIPRYTSIAIDIAHNILNDTYTIGEKIKGRSTLSSKYSVSPETIRKAIGLLREMDVVDVHEKSGITIRSKEMAFAFIEKYDAKMNIKLLHQKILELQEQKMQLEHQIQQHLNTIIDYTLKYERSLSSMSTHQTSTAIDTFEFKLEPSHYVVGKSLCETEFFKHTSATVVSVVRGSDHLLSPGPFFTFMPYDLLYVVCNEPQVQQVTDFIISGPLL